MRRVLAALLLALLAGAAVAQDPVLPSSSLVTLDQDRLFAESEFGRAVTARNEADERALAGEFRKIEAALEAEERSLTDLRARLSADDFRKLADEFDLRVEGVRRAQEARSRALVRRREEDRKRFIDTALPILSRLMEERGAVAILTSEAIVLGFGRIDITDDAIARLNSELGDGGAVLLPDDVPAPETGFPPLTAPVPAPDLSPRSIVPAP